VLAVGLPDAAARAPEDADGRAVVLGTLQLRTGPREIRLAHDSRHGWRFSRDTVLAAPETLSQLGLPWYVQRLPVALFTIRFLSLSLWQWLGLALLAPLALGIALAGQALLLASSRALARRTRTPWDERFFELLPGPLRVFLGLLLAHIALPLLRLSADPRDVVEILVRMLLIVGATWLAVRLISFGATAVEAFLTRGITDERRVHAVRTQVAVPRRIIHTGAIVVGTALVLVQFDLLRSVGVSLMASAGLAGLVLGLAAQRTIGNTLAGIQLAITQPVKIGDVVVVDGEWGWVEEIGITYVVVRVWDLRRLVVPVSTFLERTFQNWSKVESHLLGTVLLYTDYGVPVDDLRAELKRVLEATELWDRRTFSVQVTDCRERAVEVRALVSAKDGASLWDLRCLVRERLVAWLQERAGHARPVHRVEMLSPAPARA
jgi:small-conductance mechanosensitive channel